MGYKSKNKGGGGSRGSRARQQNPPPPPDRPLQQQAISIPVIPQDDPVQESSEEVTPKDTPVQECPDYASLLSGTSGLRIEDESGGNSLDSSEEQELEKRDEDEKRAAAEQERRRKIEAQVMEAMILRDEIAPLQQIWGTLTSKSKKKFINVSVEELRDHLTRSYSTIDNFDLLVNIFDEAISYCKKNKGSWKVWLCSECDESSTSSEMLVHHIREKHGNGPLPDSNDYLRLEEWIDIVRDCRWAPINSFRALGTILALERNCSVQDITNQDWPLTQDKERMRLLENIRVMFLELAQVRRCLSTANLATAMKYATENMEAYVREVMRLQHLLPKMDRVHIPICLMPKEPLETLLDFLRHLLAACDSLEVEELPDQEGSFDRSLHAAAAMEIIFSMDFNQKMTCLVLDEITRYKDNPKPFLEWLVNGAEVTSIWELWLQLKDHKIGLASLYLETYEKTRELVTPLIVRRDELDKQRDTVSSLKNRCEAELEKTMKDREKRPARRRISYLCLLKKRQDEIDCTGHESHAIKMIMKKFRCDQLDLAAMESNNDELLQKDGTVMRCLTKFLTGVVLPWNQLDTKIMRTFTVMSRLSIRFENLAGLDYRTILLPIIRSFLKEKLKKMALEDAHA